MLIVETKPSVFLILYTRTIQYSVEILCNTIIFLKIECNEFEKINFPTNNTSVVKYVRCLAVTVS
ncbi:hypothetical protein T10_3543 [Trichinella papuae]|uniref:Uncharacterized protein n=1 Tax=Trichinella papuae TaxID=268474 RepID=A0A0V1M5A4_9BILA|nr:hypothetical protein T10_3543 [Trichinella papuae]